MSQRCPYCQHRFETQRALDEHVPCPEPLTDAGAAVDRRPLPPIKRKDA